VVDVLRVSPGRRMAHLQEQEQSKDILKQKWEFVTQESLIKRNVKGYDVLQAERKWFHLESLCQTR
jgi:hypothetical protein